MMNILYYSVFILGVLLSACTETSTPVVVSNIANGQKLTATQQNFNNALRDFINHLNIGEYDRLPLGYGYIEPRDIGAEHDSWIVFDHRNLYFQATYQQAQRRFGRAPINLICAVIPSYLRMLSRPLEPNQTDTFIGEGSISSKSIYRTVYTRPIRNPRQLAVGDWVFAFKSGESDPHHTMIIAERGGELVIIGFTGTSMNEMHPRRRMAAVQVLPTTTLFTPQTELRAFKGNINCCP
ncbi:hypothetical protein [Beggiatoa leptomitoformis]|uniref:DUF2272 domain-containing protein n=1 Tax=Beggiatoa leptomitoformis TaxID=288004 RepID=A0A2N9YBW1_9GAMM|nr:hypothetical protein [Beggiatoa leptomitoformis]ALG66729.2 hypothetical protein AL038_02090 [Beggiatoa leptomitoformis]AUI67936.2 hypothetical protein BLE401_03950 [Beggiatoa leptomitoformis]